MKPLVQTALNSHTFQGYGELCCFRYEPAGDYCRQTEMAHLLALALSDALTVLGALEVRSTTCMTYTDEHRPDDPARPGILARVGLKDIEPRGADALDALARLREQGLL